MVAAPGAEAVPALTAESGRLAELSAAEAPALSAIAEPSASPAAAKEAAARLMDAMIAAPARDISVAEAPASPAGVSFDEAVSAPHRAILSESMGRRRTPWRRGLEAVGVDLLSPIPPAYQVREAREFGAKGSAPAKDVSFRVEWSQGETHVGAFSARVRLKDMAPTLRELPPPPVPEEKRLVVRFLAGVSHEQIKAFLEERRLRLLGKGYDGIYHVSVTGADEAASVARELTGAGLVYYATPSRLPAAEKDQVNIVFKKRAQFAHVPGLPIESPVGEGDIALVLRQEGLTVLPSRREGVWRVAGARGVSAETVAKRLEGWRIVLYAAPVLAEAPENRQIVLEFRQRAGLYDVTDDERGKLFSTFGLRVLADYGGGIYKVSSTKLAKSLAAKLAAKDIVQSAIAVGGVSGDRVRSAAQSAITYKGGIWSQTEYSANLASHRWGLERAGATRAQLAQFDELCAAAPVTGGRFNPYSGD